MNLELRDNSLMTYAVHPFGYIASTAFHTHVNPSNDDNTRFMPFPCHVQLSFYKDPQLVLKNVLSCSVVSNSL